MASASKIHWSPHSDDRRQQFIRINGRNHELCLYDVTSLVCLKLVIMQPGVYALNTDKEGLNRRRIKSSMSW